MVGHKTEEKLVRAVNLTRTALAGCCECDEVLFLFIGVHPQSPGTPEWLHPPVMSSSDWPARYSLPAGNYNYFCAKLYTCMGYASGTG